MKKWVVITGKQHTIVNSLEEGSTLIDALLKKNPQHTVELVNFEDYLTREDRKRKRGKQSK